LVWPIGFLSSAFVDTATMPSWLGAVAQWNPLSLTATAARSLFENPSTAPASWIGGHALPVALLCPLLLTVVFLPLAASRFRNLAR